ncbi:UDP-4-amino-4,6-dideoxy-N-acetyl-beta-L-altrosamine transaminase [Ekhidna sp.]|uniref:UDP-4-amino-4, 6-dideoxy-N-acetyl-beta-L-altrosamine transaminase n=1 Tax=Ekhidna sp. TaxID=2608089 RepID=UPI00351466E0
MSEVIPYGKQNITKEDINEVVLALKSDFLTQGPRIDEFEKTFANYIGCKYAVAVSSGTAALHLSALALGVSSGQKVITSPITFAASANCIQYCGGEVVFSDIEPDTYLIDLDYVRKLLLEYPQGTFSGIVPVDFAGRAVDMESLREIANEFGMWIIEDACHAPGGFFIDSHQSVQNCGNGSFADLAIFSFHPVKHIASGEGGMITTNDESLYNTLMKLRTHGINRDTKSFINSSSFASGVEDEVKYPAWYMEMQDLGYNYRLTDIQAALGKSQLKRANEGLLRRREIASKYYNAFKDRSFIKGQSGMVEGHAYHLYVIEVDDRLGLYNYLRGKHIFAQVHYIPCHLMPYYRSLGWNEGDLENAESYYKRCLSIPMYPTLSDQEIQYVIDSINQFYG